MAKLDRLQSRLTKVQARISNIESAYPTIVKYKGYSHNFGETRTDYQQFGPVADEYQRLLMQEEALEDRIEELQGTGGSTTVAAFREVSG